MSRHSTVTLHAAQRFLMAHLNQMLDSGKYGEPIMLHSSPGVGKSAIIAQTGRALKSRFEEVFKAEFKIWDVRVGAQQESDIQGIPHPSESGEVIEGVFTKDMAFSTPPWWPKEGQCGILLLDELANSPIPNQHACYRTIHDRSIHNGKTLPPGVIVIAAGNTKEDKTGAKGIVPALARRFMTHLFIKPSAEEFMIHAMEVAMHPTVIAYIAYDNSKIAKHPRPGELGFPCPANWESMSNLLWNRYMDDHLREIGVVGGIGAVEGTEFIGFMRNEKFFPNFDEVEKTGRYTLPTSEDFDRGGIWAIVMATTVRLINHLDGDDVSSESKKKANNLAAILRELDVSTAGIAFRTLKTANKSVISLILRDRELSELSSIITEVLQRASSMVN